MARDLHARQMLRLGRGVVCTQWGAVVEMGAERLPNQNVGLPGTTLQAGLQLACLIPTQSLPASTSPQAFRLYTEASFQQLPPSTLPEIQRTNLASVVLQVGRGGHTWSWSGWPCGD